MTNETNTQILARSAYEAGRFSEARELARAILDDEQRSDKDKEDADKILVATGADPVATIVFGFTAFLMLFLAIKYVF